MVLFSAYKSQMASKNSTTKAENETAYEVVTEKDTTDVKTGIESEMKADSTDAAKNSNKVEIKKYETVP